MPSKPKTVDASTVPKGPPGSKRTPTPTKVWIERLLAIPIGKALVYEDESDGNYATKRGIVQSYIRKGLIPNEYRVAREKTGEGKYTVYIVRERDEAGKR